MEEGLSLDFQEYKDAFTAWAGKDFPYDGIAMKEPGGTTRMITPEAILGWSGQVQHILEPVPREITEKVERLVADRFPAIDGDDADFGDAQLGTVLTLVRTSLPARTETPVG